MGARLLITACRVLTWCCVLLLAVLSLLPAQDMVRTGVPGELEHLVAYAGSAAIGIAGYGPSRGGVRVIGGFWVYAAVLEYLPEHPHKLQKEIVRVTGAMHAPNAEFELLDLRRSEVRPSPLPTLSLSPRPE